MSRPSLTSRQTPERVQEHFQSAASSFDELYTDEPAESGLQRLLRPGLFRRAEAAVSLSASLENPRVLDVGCGSGRVGERVLDAGAGEYVGLDFSAPMLELAERRLTRFGERVSLVQGDFLEQPLEGQFDLILALGLFDYIEQPHLFTRRMHALCSGTVLGSFPSWTWIRGPIRKIRYEWINDCPIFNYTERELELLFSATGFERIAVEEFTRGGYLVRADRY